MRRVVTGHTADGKAIVVRDDEVVAFPVGDRGSGAALLWGRDDPARYPDDGSLPETPEPFPPPGGSRASFMELAPEGDDFHEFVRTELSRWADPDDPGMHRTASTDYDVPRRHRGPRTR
jgi:hypothetical protein